jgi:hypothetical protein
LELLEPRVFKGFKAYKVFRAYREIMDHKDFRV